MRKIPKNPCFSENSTPSPPPQPFSDRLRGGETPPRPCMVIVLPLIDFREYVFKYVLLLNYENQAALVRWCSAFDHDSSHKS